jgi:hypothetical protein
MSIINELTPEMEELFYFTDSNRLLEQEDLEEAGFRYREDLEDLEIWEKNLTALEYNPNTRTIENYKQI